MEPIGLGAGAPAAAPQPAAAAAPVAPPPAPGQPDANGLVGEAASPEEQQQYDTFVSLAMDALYDKKMSDKTAKFLQAAPDPVSAVGEVASSLAARVYKSAKSNGQEIDGGVILNAGAEVVELVVEFAEQVAGLPEFSEEQMTDAFTTAADIFSQTLEKDGTYSDEAKAADVQGLNQLRDSGAIQKITGGAAPPQGA